MLKRQHYISYLRCISMVLIVSCHLAQASTSGLINMSGQFLNVGVYIFFVISGYLYGMKKINTGYKEWYINRFKKVVLPVYIFLIILFILYLINGYHIHISDWIYYLFGLQGFFLRLTGAGHLWFLTVLMLCYLITPLLDYFRDHKSKKLKVTLFVLLVIIQILVAYLISDKLGIYLFDLILYIVSYYIGYKEYKCHNKKQLITFIMLFILSIIVRLAGKMICDNTTTYDVMIVGITHSLIALSSLVFSQYLFDHKPNKIVQLLDSISYEVYLVHYMFIVGPVSLMSVTNMFVVNCLLVFIVSFISAYALHLLTSKIIK